MKKDIEDRLVKFYDMFDTPGELLEFLREQESSASSDGKRVLNEMIDVVTYSILSDEKQ